MERIALKCLGQLISSGQMEDKHLSYLTEQVGDLPDGYDMSALVRAEACYAIDCYIQTLSGQVQLNEIMDGTLPEIDVDANQFDFGRAVKDFYYHYKRLELILAGDDFGTKRWLVKEYKKEIYRRMDAIQNDPFHDIVLQMSKDKRTDAMTLLFLSVMSTATSTLYSTDTTYVTVERCTDTLIAIERYFLKHGSLPLALDDLMPEFVTDVPKDPYDNQPLRYRKIDGGFEIYAIGSDLVDNSDTEDDRREDFVIEILYGQIRD